tara:strand:+ start:420 stop:641 length:222 start_codon:yes stop_codon:yes gene_type:complete
LIGVASLDRLDVKDFLARKLEIKICLSKNLNVEDKKLNFYFLDRVFHFSTKSHTFKKYSIAIMSLEKVDKLQK